jgi:hypothetical protein
MEHHVVLEKMCGCARRKKIPQVRTCDSKEEAFGIAKIWANELNQVFCGEHAFGVVEVDDHFVISVEEGSY